MARVVKPSTYYFAMHFVHLSSTLPVENSFRNYLKDRITLRIFMNLGNLKLTVIPSLTVFLATHANIITSDLQI